jgi:hypothetical protein
MTSIRVIYHCIASTLVPLFYYQSVRKLVEFNNTDPSVCLNVSIKIFTKVATNRLMSVAQKVINPTQMAFLPRRNIMEGVVILHETVHELHRKNKVE